ncbi:hypothetical protein [Croceiramulus getboli]|nr:hypothetical protein P8624_03860 [Flavobacteriaceae bacterium YJPT1-3]
MIKLFTTLCLLLSCTVFAQNNFVSGFYIDNAGNQKSGMIEYSQWVNTPQNFQFKSAPEANPQTLNTALAQVVDLGSRGRFERHTVQMDQSSTKINDLSRERDPNYQEQTVFLEVLIDSSPKLYQYQSSSEQHFFLQSAQAEALTPLVYKKYLRGTKVVENNYYKQQLKNALSCNTLSDSVFEGVDYQASDLINLMEINAACGGSVVSRRAAVKPTGELDLSAVAGISLSQLTVPYNEDGNQLFDRSSTAVFGFDLEYTIPADNPQWKIFFSPTYLSYSENGNRDVISNTTGQVIETRRVDAEVKFVSLPFGVRYEIPLGEKWGIVTQLGYALYLQQDSKLVLEGNEEPQAFKESTNGGILGLGVEYDAFRLLLQYNFNQEMSKDFEAQFNSLSVRLAYRFLKV